MSERIEFYDYRGEPQAEEGENVPVDVESAVESEEGDKERLFQDSMFRLIEKVVKRPESKIGEGKTADVFYPDEDPNICLKVIVDRDTHGKVPDRVLPSKKDKPWFRPVEKEAEFLAALAHVDTRARVPKPLVSAVFDREDEGEHEGKPFYVKETVKVLAMERLDAVSLRDVFDGKEEPPPNFSRESFVKDLRDFTGKMHQQGIHHRDMHAGNVLIHRKEATPRIIDFGAAAFASAESAEAYFEETIIDGKPIMLKFKPDVEWVDEIDRELTKRERVLNK